MPPFSTEQIIAVIVFVVGGLLTEYLTSRDNSFLLMKVPVPAILVTILTVIVAASVPIAIGVGVSLMPSDPNLTIWWFSLAAALTIIGVSLWNKIQKLDAVLRMAIRTLTIIFVLVGISKADDWVVAKVQQSFLALDIQTAQASRTMVLRFLAVKSAPTPAPPKIIRITQKAEPPVPEAKLVFSFMTVYPDDFPILETNAPLVDGAVTVVITARNQGTAPAKNGWLVITICEGCRYAEEPQNTVPSPVAQAAMLVRQRRFDEIYVGTIAVGIKLKIIPPPNFTFFDIGAESVCDGCPPSVPKPNIESQYF